MNGCKRGLKMEETVRSDYHDSEGKTQGMMETLCVKLKKERI
jgi:hypothetical protein